MQFTTTSEQAQINGVKIIVFGDTGVGKTMLAATTPNPIIISAENGLLSLAPKNIQSVYGDDKSINYNIPVIKVSSITDLENTYDWLTFSQEANQFSTVILDSLSDISEVLLAAYKPKYKDARMAYMQLYDKFYELVRAFRDISGKNVMMIAKCERMKDSENITRYYPMFPGSKLGLNAGYYFDFVFPLFVKREDSKMQRVLQTQPDITYQAKSRWNDLDFYEPPNISKILNKIGVY